MQGTQPSGGYSIEGIGSESRGSGSGNNIRRMCDSQMSKNAGAMGWRKDETKT